MIATILSLNGGLLTTILCIHNQYLVIINSQLKLSVCLSVCLFSFLKYFFIFLSALLWIVLVTSKYICKLAFLIFKKANLLFVQNKRGYKVLNNNIITSNVKVKYLW